MNALIVIISILFTSVIGLVTLIGLNLISFKNKLFVISISFGLGVGLIATQLFFYSRFGISWQRESILIPWIIVIFVFIFKINKDFRFKKFPSLEVVDLTLLFLILLSFLYTSFEALIRPVAVWDAWATWLLESKVFFIDAKINPDIFNYLHSEYPLFFKLFGTFIYIILGKVDDTSVLLVSFAFYVFLSLLFFSLLKEKFGIRYALIATFLFVTIQNFIRHGGRMEAGLADLPLGYYGFASYALFINYFYKSTAKNILLLNIFLGITMLIKFEGIPLSIIIGICAIYHIYKQKHYKHLPFLLFWILPYIDWQIFRKLSGATSAYSERHHFDLSVFKTINAFGGTLKELITIKSWNFLWIAYFYSLFISPTKKHKELIFLHLIILAQFSIYLLVYIFTSNYNPESSIERLLLHIAPMAFYTVAIVAYSKTYRLMLDKGKILFKNFNRMITKF